MRYSHPKQFAGTITRRMQETCRSVTFIPVADQAGIRALQKPETRDINRNRRGVGAHPPPPNEKARQQC